MDTMIAHGEHPKKSEIRFILATELRNTHSVQVIEDMLQSVEEALADALDTCFNAGTTSVEPDFIHFVELSWIDMAHRGLIVSNFRKGIEHST